MSIEVIIDLTTRLLNRLKEVENCVDQNDTEIKNNIVKKMSYYKNNLYKDNIGYILEYVYQVLFVKEYNLFCVKFNIIDYFKTIKHNCWYIIKVSTDYNTLSLSFKQKLTSSLPNECSDFIKANCIYSLLLKYYTIWTSYYTNTNTSVTVDTDTDRDEETVFLIERILKKMCRKNVTSNRIFYRIKYFLTHYKPVYNSEVENYFISRDGHGATQLLNYHYIDRDPKEKANINLYSFTLNEILCFAYKDVYDQSNTKEDNIGDIFFFFYYVIESFILDDDNVYKCFQYYLYSMDVVHTNTNTVVFKDKFSNIEYRYLQYLTKSGKKSDDKEYIINVDIDYKNNQSILIYKIDIKEQNNADINSITFKEFSTNFNLNGIQNVFFKRGRNICGSISDMDIIIDIYSTIFVPIIKDRIINTLKDIDINICDDVIDYVFKEYL